MGINDCLSSFNARKGFRENLEKLKQMPDYVWSERPALASDYLIKKRCPIGGYGHQWPDEDSPGGVSSTSSRIQHAFKFNAWERGLLKEVVP